MSRHEARETALKMLFQLIEGNNEWPMAELTLKEAGLSRSAAEFAGKLAKGAWQKRFEMEQYIGMFTSGWQYERLCSVDRLVLQLAMYELKYAEATPAPIVIDEAIELARTFGTDESPAFVNAVLDNFLHKVIQEDSPDYRLDEGLLQRQSMVVETPAVQDTPYQEAAPAEKPELPITKEFAASAKGFRKIRRSELTEADKIMPEPDDPDNN